MPIYEYQCEKCGHSFEQIVFSNDEEPASCPECKGKHVKRLLSSTSFIGNSSGSGCSTGAPSGFS